MSYKHNLMQPRLWGFTYSPSVTNKAWKLYTLQVIEFVYMHSTYFLSVLNMVLSITYSKFWNSCICTLFVQYMNSKLDSRLVMNYVYRASTFSFSHYYISLRWVRHDVKPSEEKVMHLTRCNLGKFLVVPTFVARRLHSCKDARHPSNESWNYFWRRLASNFCRKDRFHAIYGSVSGSPNMSCYPLFNKKQAAWKFLCSELEVTWRTVNIIIRIGLFSQYLWIRGVSLCSIYYNQTRRVYFN